MDTTPTSHPDGSGWYAIRLRGRLDARWSAHFEGMNLTTGDGFTLLEGRVVDQAALHGLLHQLRDIGLPLVSVTLAVPDPAESTSTHPDTTSSGA
jgi:hypothetical protein